MYKIILTGGGTMGSVSPLLALKEIMDRENIQAEIIWIGTPDGLEREQVAKENIAYYAVQSGKLRRYWSWQNIVDPFRLLWGVFQSWRIINKFQPDLIISAGGYVCVPVVWAAWLAKKKSIVHQQDIKAGLANLLMSRCATKITVTFESSLKDFPKEKTVWTGNPVRPSILEGKRQYAINHFNLDETLPTLFILGGSLGSEYLNQLTVETIPQLITFCQVIHLTGKDNEIEWMNKDQYGELSSRYHQYDYLFEDLKDAYAVADLMVCRAGLSTLTELTALAKPAIIISIPNHQQEANAQFFAKRNAVVMLDQNSTTDDVLASLAEELLTNKHSLERLRENIRGLMPESANQKYWQLIQSILAGSK